MLSTKKITVEAKTVVDGKAIHGHRAIVDENGVSMLPYQIDKEACKAERAIVRADHADFEDYVYELQETIFAEKQGE